MTEGTGPGRTIEVEEGDAGAPVTIRPGDALAVRLRENPTTGYRWAVAGVDDQVLVPEGDDYVPDGDRPGGGGWHLFRFRAVGSGRTTLSFARRRPWEAAGPEADDLHSGQPHSGQPDPRSPDRRTIMVSVDGSPPET